MDLSKLKDKICTFTKGDILSLSDEELLQSQREGNILWNNGIRLRGILDLLLEEYLIRSRKRAMSYTDDEVFNIIVKIISEGFKKQNTVFSQSLTKGADMLRNYFTNSGGTLSDEDGFSIGMVFYSSKGVRASIDNSPYQVKDFNNVEGVIDSFNGEAYRELKLSYSQLYKLILIRENTKSLHDEIMKSNEGYADKEIIVDVGGQLSLV